MMSIQPETECCLGDVKTRTDTECRDGVSSSAVVGYSLQTDHGVTSSIQPCGNIRDNSQTLSSFQSAEARWNMHPVCVSSHNENNCETSPEKCRPGDDLDEDLNPAEGQSQRDAMMLNQKTLVDEIIKSSDNSKPRTSLQNISDIEPIFSERSYREPESRSNKGETVKNKFKENVSNFQDLEVECKLDNEEIYFEKLQFECQSKSNEVILSEDEKYDGCEDQSDEEFDELNPCDVCDDSLRDARCDVVVQNSATHDGSCHEASCCEFRQDTRCQHSQTENDFIEVSLFQQRNCVDLSYFSESITSDNLWNENNSKEVPGYLDDVTQRCDKGDPNLVELVDDLDQNSDERSSDEESEIKRQGESQFHGDHKHSETQKFEHRENSANCCTNDSGVDLVDQFELKDKSRFYDDQKYELDDCNELSHRESLNHSESYNESVISTGSYTEPNCNECIGRNALYSHKSSHDLISGDHCDDAIATTDQKNITLHKDPNNDYTHQVDPDGDETRHYEPCNDHDELGNDPSQQEEELNLQGHRKHIDVAESLQGLDESGHEAKYQKNPSDFPEFEIIDDPSIKAHNESNDIVNHLEFADDPVQNGDPPEFLGDETILVPVPTSAATPAVVSTRAKKRKKQKTKLEKQLAKYVGSQDTGRKKKLVPTYSSFKNFLPIPEDEFHPDFTCPVCLDLFHRPHILTPCQHMFCEPCLRKLPTSALGDNTVCPLCRCDIRACTLDIDLHEQLSYYYSVLYNKRARREKKLRTNQKPLPRLYTTPLSQQLIRQLFRSSQSQRRHQTNHLYVVLGMCMSGILSVLYVWANIPIEITVGPIRTAAVSNIWIQAICLFMVLSWIFVRLLQTFAEGTPR